MSYKTIMIYVSDTPLARQQVDYACRLAIRFGAKLVGITAQLPQAPPIDPYSSSMITSEIMELEKAAAEKFIEASKIVFETATANLALEREWRSALDLPADFIARESRTADLVLIGEDSSQLPRSSAPWAGDIVMTAGRPVLILPKVLPSSADMDNVLIAWKDTRETRLALYLALPLLRQAQKVTILRVCNEDDIGRTESEVSDVAGFLLRHDIKADGMAQVLTEKTVAAQILASATRDKADMIVMGGYGHSRFREWAFGGVTRDILQDCAFPRLLAH